MISVKINRKYINNVNKFENGIIIIKMEQEVLREGIYELPNELIMGIFEYLEVKEKLKLGATCKWMYNNMTENVEAERIMIELLIGREWYIGEKGMRQNNRNIIRVIRNKEKMEENQFDEWIAKEHEKGKLHVYEEGYGKEVINKYEYRKIRKEIYDRLLGDELMFDDMGKEYCYEENKVKFEYKYRDKKIEDKHGFLLYVKLEKILGHQQ